MSARCPTCGAVVASIFEHVDAYCRPIADAPRNTIITGLFADDVRYSIRWEPERAHPGGGPSMGPGWVDAEEGMPVDAPQAWEPLE